MSSQFRIGEGSLRVIKDGIIRFHTDDAHMVVLSRVVGTHDEPQRNGSRTPAINNNVNILETVTIASCDPGATHLIGSLVVTLGDGDTYSPNIPAGKHYTFMGGTFIFAHNYDWYAGYTIWLDAGSVKLTRRIVSNYAAPDTGITYFNLRAFSIAYKLRAIRFL